MKMSNIKEPEEFDPQQIAEALFKRCMQAKVWYVYCYIEEEWIPKKAVPFDVSIVNGVFACKVVCPSYVEAQKIVSDFLPVIKFIEDPEIDNE